VTLSTSISVVAASDDDLDRIRNKGNCECGPKRDPVETRQMDGVVFAAVICRVHTHAWTHKLMSGTTNRTRRRGIRRDDECVEDKTPGNEKRGKKRSRKCEGKKPELTSHGC